ncbi:hypothetical protein IQ270_06960 [Microcoleus sp. LEGE 07076]|uniref:hypothetical protein n=1 Tax=Microcoleus sp. LEGE 07076 TaxID=915322 RepID=UPI0018804633|nr:hypothetical protein [Microcoleus sp. LEGE 07076]MBE9184466.1 hypothetical protein [Microcoleus sp. LEGE 07076]
MQTANKTSVVDNRSDGETNDDSLGLASVSKDTITHGQAKDVVPPCSNKLDGIMWNDRLEAEIGNDLLCGEEGNEKSLEKFPAKTNLVKFLTFVIYSETVSLD